MYHTFYQLWFFKCIWARGLVALLCKILCTSSLTFYVQHTLKFLSWLSLMNLSSWTSLTISISLPVSVSNNVLTQFEGSAHIECRALSCQGGTVAEEKDTCTGGIDVFLHPYCLKWDQIYKHTPYKYCVIFNQLKMYGIPHLGDYFKFKSKSECHHDVPSATQCWINIFALSWLPINKLCSDRAF